jgi:hypothetical protein
LGIPLDGILEVEGILEARRGDPALLLASPLATGGDIRKETYAAL